MSRLIQNAVYLPERDFYLISSHVHDYKEYVYDEHFTMMVDGGKDYIRRAVIPPEYAHLVVSYDLSTDSPREEVLDKLLWGSLPLDKTKPQVHTFRPIRLLTKEHLQAILDNCPTMGALHRDVVKYWLAVKSA